MVQVKAQGLDADFKPIGTLSRLKYGFSNSQTPPSSGLGRGFIVFQHSIPMILTLTIFLAATSGTSRRTVDRYHDPNK